MYVHSTITISCVCVCVCVCVGGVMYVRTLHTVCVGRGRRVDLCVCACVCAHICCTVSCLFVLLL